MGTTVWRKKRMCLSGAGGGSNLESKVHHFLFWIHTIWHASSAYQVLYTRWWKYSGSSIFQGDQFCFASYGIVAYVMLSLTGSICSTFGWHLLLLTQNTDTWYTTRMFKHCLCFFPRIKTIVTFWKISLHKVKVQVDGLFDKVHVTLGILHWMILSMMLQCWIYKR